MQQNEKESQSRLILQNNNGEIRTEFRILFAVNNDASVQFCLGYLRTFVCVCDQKHLRFNGGIFELPIGKE